MILKKGLILWDGLDKYLSFLPLPHFNVFSDQLSKGNTSSFTGILAWINNSG
jgi:hypothetical protein